MEKLLSSGLQPWTMRKWQVFYLLERVVGWAGSEGISELNASTYSKKTCDLIESFGGKALNSSTERTLNLKDYDWSVANAWLAPKSDDWVVKRYNRISEGLVDEIAELSFEAFNEVWSMDGWSTQDCLGEYARWLRSLDEAFDSEGCDYICITISQSEGVVGMIEGTLNRQSLDFFLQRLVAAGRPFRDQGIAKLLKASMLDLFRTRCALTVDTSNNDANTSMLSINQRLGFKTVSTRPGYRIDITKSLGVLGS